ncbi:hypothetical protein EMIHUDRAFT_259796 [Emiliania huxleyi CCMP1516]|uniref:Uncharacterized protein n=2 Tax=Emiliania huxleyi TaxID=2903 RepID=A0A0D3HXU7_EMIH1|nr:hypothetical protein EMIHUDRAFT_259796 [Emiliania huxleyi CCMP1516]EOD03832.1 hypothetical protein EMIHUDRAFT_259796 [Emiliania huxleyi CCMP1516]|eukprot:XP_005756261.1 hypothetical protein EMIHUDRAFT_259796 [Emiliania huxleyi CCMP1516]
MPRRTTFIRVTQQLNSVFGVHDLSKPAAPAKPASETPERRGRLGGREARSTCFASPRLRV